MESPSAGLWSEVAELALNGTMALAAMTVRHRATMPGPPLPC
jgi:hypothetical protein